MTNDVDPFKEFEFPQQFPQKPKKFSRLRLFISRFYVGIKKVAPIAAVASLVLVSVGIYFGYPVYKNYNYTDPALDGYVS